ncbi:MAG: hypothetical protein JNL74_04045, partial [Fibrobacteres bacterium]|nr:hypothetical protein [Fibrobacterota bacterium]
MKSLELTLAPKVQTDNLEKTWEKIPVRGVDGERHHALPVRNDEERAAFNRELKSKIEAFTTSEKRDNHSEKKNVTSSKKNEKNCDAPAVERVKKEEVSSEEFSEESVEAAAAAVIEGDAVATPEESIEATKEVAETTDPVNGLINDKIEKIKELCAKLGIEVNTDNLTNEEFIAKAIKILEHLLNPIHEDSLITVRVSVEDAVAQMQQNPAVKEPVTADEIMPAMEALLYELVALQTLLKSSVASIDKDALMSEIAELTGETEVAADADMMIESVKPESETPKEIKIANVELIEDSVAPVVSDKIVVTSEAVPAVKPEEIAVVTTPVTASVVAEKKAIEIPEDVKSTENEIKGEKNDSLELVDAVLKTDDKEETLTGEQFTSQ